MSKPIIAIVGRANVGKSTLFNRIARRRRAVIEDSPGITRDRLYAEAIWEDRHFLIVDTGGFLHEPEEEIYSEVKKQILLSVEEADIIIMLLDAESGILPLDIELIDRLRKFGKKIFYAVNKIDGPKKEKALYDFYSLGVDLFPLSALNGYGYENLMDEIISIMPLAGEEKNEYPKIAIVGRPNVGKSTLVNSLLSRERMIVSAIPGTTRDAVDSVCSYYRKKYVLVDTAGIRRKGMMAKTVERYSFIRTMRNIEDSNIAIIVIDASDGIVEMDQKIAGYVHSAKKGSVILLNKWDLVDKSAISLKEIEKEVHEKLWFMRYAPVITISALTRKRVTKLFSVVDRVMKENCKRISTHKLNIFLGKVLSMREPPIYRGKRVKIYYITQIKTDPPGFIIFTNRKEGVKEQYLKFMEKQLREDFSFEGVPVELYVRQRK